MRTLDAVLSQTFRDWECLVVDDFSTDHSWDVLQGFAKKDPRIIPIRNELNKGACGARNTGIIHAKGQYVQFFDSDDIMHDSLLQELYNVFNEKSADIDVATCWTNVVNVETGKIVNRLEHIADGNIHRQLLCGATYVDTNCALIKRQIVQDIGGWSEDCPSYQEWDFHLRLSSKAEYKTVRKHLIDYYVGGIDTISKNLPRAVRGTLYILQKFQKEFISIAPYNYYKNCAFAYARLRQLKKQNHNSYLELKGLYIDSVLLSARLLVVLMYPFTFIKSRLTKSNNK